MRNNGEIVFFDPEMCEKVTKEGRKQLNLVRKVISEAKKKGFNVIKVNSMVEFNQFNEKK